LSIYPGWLHMMHHPADHFPPHVKTILMSQSDFQLPPVNVNTLDVEKEYDFTYAATWPLGSGADPENGRCEGWSGYCKNWTFAHAALDVMCGEFGMKGVLIATKAKDSDKHCDLPASCAGKMIQTPYIDQHKYFGYLKKSRFAFIPQMHDASPRVSTQALVHDVPLLMNKHISGGWKYINDNTGEFFQDMRDFRQQLSKILAKSKKKGTPDGYHPRKWTLENYGNENSGKRLLKFIQDNFSDRVKLPKGTKLLLT